MLVQRPRFHLFILLLAVVFLAAQFHFCADLTSSQSGTHLCPVCSSTISVVSPAAPGIAFAPIMNSLEISVSATVLSPTLPRSISPRAPPAL
jgi:hypothetical protein